MTTITIILLVILALSMLCGICGLLALSLCRTAKRGDAALNYELERRLKARILRRMK